MITLQQVSKTFQSKAGAVDAVREVTLEINQGEIFGIIGFSGAGKSTLIRCMNLLERPTTGKVIVDRQDITALKQKELREVRRGIGMIFQHFNLLRSRTVSQNIAFPLKKSTLSKGEKEKKISALLELVGLSDKRDAYPSQLSGGQKQRVAIARALANEPKVLLCDEATSALDPQTTKSILKLLKKLNETMGITIVLITHEMAVVKEICDRVAIMQNGQLVEEGTTQEVFLHPKQKLTQDFIHTAGDMDKIYELIEEEHEATRMEPGDKMVLMTYSGENATEAVISHLAEAFGVKANIIYGNIDILKGKPIGRLIVILHGAPDKLQSSMAYIQSRGVELEVVKE